MVRINLPQTSPQPITSADFKTYDLPVPSQGVNGKNAEGVFLVFDNEDEAVVYADQLEEIVKTVSKSSPLKNILRDVVTAIRNDDSIRNYLENSSIYTWVKNRVKGIRSVMKPYPTLN